MAPTADLNNLLTKKCNTVTIGSLILARVYSFIYILGLLPKSYHYIWVLNQLQQTQTSKALCSMHTYQPFNVS